MTISSVNNVFIVDLDQSTVDEFAGTLKQGSNPMSGKIAVLLMSSLLLACVPSQPLEIAAPPAPPPPQAQTAAPPPAVEGPPPERIVAIRRATCSTFLNLSPDDRAMASMFYLGYEASHFRSATIDVNAIPIMQSFAQTYCTSYPNRTVAEAFAEAYLAGR